MKLLVRICNGATLDWCSACDVSEWMRLVWVSFALSTILAFGAQEYGRGHPERMRQAPTVLSVTADGIENPNQPQIDFGQGSSVVRAEILLERAHFSMGEIDGKFGTNLLKTLALFIRVMSVQAHMIRNPGTMPGTTIREVPRCLLLWLQL